MKTFIQSIIRTGLWGLVNLVALATIIGVAVFTFLLIMHFLQSFKP